jgi:hypothetical protein
MSCQKKIKNQMDASKERFKDFCFRKHVEEHLRDVKERQKVIYGRNIDKLPFEIDLEKYEWEAIYIDVMLKMLHYAY